MPDIMTEDDRWTAVDLSAIAKRAVQATMAHAGLGDAETEISILACDDERIAVLNSDFRGKPAPTNVLSWPADDLAAAQRGAQPRAPAAGPDGIFALGDVAIAFETTQREAKELGKPLAEHTTHLLVHGTLHLLGYDHIHDSDAVLMQDAERKILGNLGLDDPY